MLEGLRKNNFLVIGRAGMDLYADPPGAETEHADTFTSALGGSSANIAVAIAKQGGAATLLTSVSDDAIGRFIINQLQRYRIDTSLVRKVGGRRVHPSRSSRHAWRTASRSSTAMAQPISRWNRRRSKILISHPTEP